MLINLDTQITVLELSYNYLGINYLSPSIFSFYQRYYAINFGQVAGVLGEMALMKGRFVVYNLICLHLN